LIFSADELCGPPLFLIVKEPGERPGGHTACLGAIYYYSRHLELD
jgi:hypothetical protein